MGLATLPTPGRLELRNRGRPYSTANHLRGFIKWMALARFTEHRQAFVASASRCVTAAAVMLTQNGSRCRPRGGPGLEVVGRDRTAGRRPGRRGRDGRHGLTGTLPKRSIVASASR